MIVRRRTVIKSILCVVKNVNMFFIITLYLLFFNTIRIELLCFFNKIIILPCIILTFYAYFYIIVLLYDNIQYQNVISSNSNKKSIGGYLS